MKWKIIKHPDNALPYSNTIKMASSDVIQMANVVPLEEIYLPTVLHKDDPLEVLDFTIRLHNALVAHDIRTVGELCDFPEKDFLKVKNIGNKSLDFLKEVRKQIIEKHGELADGISSPNTSPLLLPEPEETIIPNNKLIEVLLERCGTERTKAIITRRYGLHTGERQTLEEIGESYGVTRERIRQLQVKTLKKMKHPSTKARSPLIRITEKVLFENGGIISDEEADVLITQALNSQDIDGNSLLDLLSDLGWLQNYRIGDVILYCPNFGDVSLEKFSDSLLSTLSKDNFGMSCTALASKTHIIKKISNNRFNAEEFILRYCRLDPRVKESDNLKVPSFKDEHSSGQILFQRYSPWSHRAEKWLSLILRVLEEEQTPLHFTEITNRVNDRLVGSDVKLDVRRAHALLIQSDKFAHTGIRGTYGLTTWGLRKESTPELVDECLNRAGFPLHWKQIYNYVSKYKDSKPASIVAILEQNGKYKRIDSGTFWFK